MFILTWKEFVYVHTQTHAHANQLCLLRHGIDTTNIDMAKSLQVIQT